MFHHADDYVHRIGRTGRAGRAGTAISIVTPADQKSMVAIEKLIGQSIPLAEVSAETPPAEHSASRPKAPQRSRQGGREDSRGRKPRRDREPKRSVADRSSEGQPQPALAAFPATAPASRPPSIGRAPSPQPEGKSPEPADHSHLPAFLLRPVRARV